MRVDFDVVDALAGLAEDLRSEGDLVDRFHDAVVAIKKERDAARAEVERLRRELDKATDDHIESQRNGAREAIARKAAEAEIERLNALGALLSADIQRLTRRVAEDEADWMALRAEAATAFARGAAAMREAASRECWTASDELADVPDMESEQGTLQNVAHRIRALPDPKDK